LVLAVVAAAPSRADEYRDLFNGKDFDGWVIEGPNEDREKQPVWAVKDGLIVCSGKVFGFLRYDRQKFGDFSVRVEYRFAPPTAANRRGNSGLGVRMGSFDPKRSSLTRASYASYEIQLQDDAGRPANAHTTGSLYRYAAPTANPVKPAPEWNTVEVECVGPRIQVTVNGQKVLDADQTTLADIPGKPAGAPAPKDKPLVGSVALQSHSGQVEFRKVQVREIKAEPGKPDDGESGDVQQLIARFLKAAGGEDRLAQPRAYTFKEVLTTTTRANPAGTVAKQAHYMQPPDKSRIEVESQEDGKPVKSILVKNGNKGWTKREGERREMSRGGIASTFETQRSFGYKFLLILKDPAYDAAPLGESKVGDRVVIGVKLTPKPMAGPGARERRLYFDKQSGLLVKSEVGAGTTYSEIMWGDCRMVDGIAVPHRVTYAIKREEGLTYDRVYSDFRFADKFDPQLFEAP
jgi:hypothetical protein